jgi:hypothetical protein
MYKIARQVDNGHYLSSGLSLSLLKQPCEFLSNSTEAPLGLLIGNTSIFSGTSTPTAVLNYSNDNDIAISPRKPLKFTMKLL